MPSKSLAENSCFIRSSAENNEYVAASTGFQWSWIQSLLRLVSTELLPLPRPESAAQGSTIMLSRGGETMRRSEVCLLYLSDKLRVVRILAHIQLPGTRSLGLPLPLKTGASLLSDISTTTTALSPF